MTLRPGRRPVAPSRDCARSLAAVIRRSSPTWMTPTGSRSSSGSGGRRDRCPGRSRWRRVLLPPSGSRPRPRDRTRRSGGGSRAARPRARRPGRWRRARAGLRCGRGSHSRGLACAAHVRSRVTGATVPRSPTGRGRPGPPAPGRSPAGRRDGGRSRGHSVPPGTGLGSPPRVRARPLGRPPPRPGPRATRRCGAPRPRRGPGLGPGSVVARDPLGRTEERRQLRAREPCRPIPQCRHLVAVGAVARLVQRRIPRAEQALARATAERLGQQVIEERGEDQLRCNPEEALAQPDLGPALRRNATDKLCLGVSKGAPRLRGDQRRTVARNAIGGGSAADRRSISSDDRRSTRARNRASRSAGVPRTRSGRVDRRPWGAVARDPGWRAHGVRETRGRYPGLRAPPGGAPVGPR